MENEIWKDIKGYEGLYQISNKGRVKSLRRAIRVAEKLGGFRVKGERILLHDVGKFGYHRVHLLKNHKGKHLLVHRLVADAFIDNPMNLPQINHKDENKGNNVVSNLEWCTAKYNSNYGDRTERTAVAKFIPVSVFDMEGQLVQDFESLKEAEQLIGTKIHPKYLKEHHSIRGFQVRRKGEYCGPYVATSGKYTKK